MLFYILLVALTHDGDEGSFRRTTLMNFLIYRRKPITEFTSVLEMFQFEHFQNKILSDIYFKFIRVLLFFFFLLFEEDQEAAAALP